MNALQRSHKECEICKDHMKAGAEKGAENHKILNWIRTPNDNKDPEQSQRDILLQTGMNDEKYANAGEWFISEAFREWIDAFENAEDQDEEELKRVLGINGTSKRIILMYNLF